MESVYYRFESRQWQLRVHFFFAFVAVRLRTLMGNMDEDGKEEVPDECKGLYIPVLVLILHCHK